LNVPGQAIEAQVSYDWTGDGSWDRTELFGVFTPNNIPDFENWNVIGAPAPKGKLAGSTGAWNNLVGGSVRLQLWSAYPTLSPIYVRTDTPINGQFSYLKIPFITVWWGGNYTGEGACGMPNAPATGYITTADQVLTSTSSTTGRRTTTGSATTGSKSTTSSSVTTGGSTSGANTATSASSVTSSSSSSPSTSSEATSTSGSVDPCADAVYSCTNYTCPCNEKTCQIKNGKGVWVLTPVAQGTQCTVNQDPVCFVGTCDSKGACQPTNGLSECNGPSTTTATSPNGNKVTSLGSKLVISITTLFLGTLTFMLL